MTLPARAAEPAAEDIGPASPGWATDEAVPADWRRQWIERGYVVARGIHSAADVKAHREIVRRVRAALDESKDEHGYGERIGQLHQMDPDLMRLAGDKRILRFLEWAFGERPVLFGSLNFERGTQQEAHIDAIFFYTEPVYAMAGLWVALEDVHPDAGPLFYLPGSHRWPFIRGEHLWEARPELTASLERARGRSRGHADRVRLAGLLGQAWTQRMKAMEPEQGGQRELALLKAGDVVIWHALLAHGGSPVHDRARSRRSVVYHYIGETARLYTFDQFFLNSRAEIRVMAGQKNRRSEWPGLTYIDYGYYVSYKDGREIVHRL